MAIHGKVLDPYLRMKKIVCKIICFATLRIRNKVVCNLYSGALDQAAKERETREALHWTYHKICSLEDRIILLPSKPQMSMSWLFAVSYTDVCYP